MVPLPPCEMWTKFVPVSLFYGQLIFENKHPLFLGLNGLIYRGTTSTHENVTPLMTVYLTYKNISTVLVLLVPALAVLYPHLQHLFI